MQMAPPDWRQCACVAAALVLFALSDHIPPRRGAMYSGSDREVRAVGACTSVGRWGEAAAGPPCIATRM